MRSALIVGGNGLIGSALTQALCGFGIRVAFTSKINNPPGIFLDLSLPLNLESLPTVDVVYLCAAISRFEDCEKVPLLARRVNVTAQLELAEYFFRRGSHVIFLSTNAVFDGMGVASAEDEVVNPVSFYGKLKADAEHKLSNLAYRYAGALAICRFTKVFSIDSPIIVDWIKKIKDGSEVEALVDRTISPISLCFAVQGLVQCGISKITGKLHFSGREEFSYFHFAKALARSYGASQTNISPVFSKTPYRGNRLAMNHTEKIMGIQAQTLDSVLDHLR